MLLRVLDLASGVCLALDPEFPEVVHRGPSLNWSGGGGWEGHIPIRGVAQNLLKKDLYTVQLYFLSALLFVS